MAEKIIVIDEGTTSTRTMLFGADGIPLGSAQREIQQHYPGRVRLGGPRVVFPEFPAQPHRLPEAPIAPVSLSHGEKPLEQHMVHTSIGLRFHRAVRFR